MMHFARPLFISLPLLACQVALSQEPGPSGEPPRKRLETFDLADGRKLRGQLRGDTSTGFRFEVVDNGPKIPLVTGSRISLETAPASQTALPPPFLVLFGGGLRLSGRLAELSTDKIRLDDGPGLPGPIVARGGAVALIQRPGEASVLLDGFESIDAGRWSVTGDPDVGADPDGPSGRSLHLPSLGASLTTRLPEPVAAGRLEIVYHDPGKKFVGRRQFVDMSFRAPSGDLSTVRVVIGWADETLGVESPTGPTLAVQPLARRAGWHRLAVRFAADHLDLAVDRLELAHGDGPSGPLSEIRLATEVLGGAEAAPGLVARFDDLQLSRLAAPSGRLEIDPSQDEVRLVTGDQVFGSISGANDRSVRVIVDDRSAKLPWSEVSGLYFHRNQTPGAAVDGLLVRVDWQAASTLDAIDNDSMEGALVAADETTISLETPFAGTLKIPRDRLVRLEVIGKGRRLVLDSKPHHLGDRLVEDLDPPQAEGDSLSLNFDLPRALEGQPRFVVDVVQAVSAEGNVEQRVNPGELLTHVVLNDVEIDTLNRHVTPRNESPERISIAIPAGALRVGRNVLKFRQDGSKEDPRKRDNLGLLGIALESASSAPAAPGGSQP